MVAKPAVLSVIFQLPWLFISLVNGCGAGSTNSRAGLVGDTGVLGVCRSGLLGVETILSGHENAFEFLNLPQKESKAHSSSTSKPSSPLYTIIPIHQKGFGMVAATSIPRGTPIIIEKPLISAPIPEMVPGFGFRLSDMLPSIESSFNALSPSQQSLFLSLHDHRFPSEDTSPDNPQRFSQSHLLTIFRSNAYNTGPSQIGLFPKIARINHSCRPNAGNHWNEDRNERVIYASRDIAPGEEVTVSYVPLLMSTSNRQARLQQYGFACTCEACTAEDGLEGDKRRSKIEGLFESLEQKEAGKKSKKIQVNERLARKAERLVKLLEEEGLGDYDARAYRLAGLFAARNGEIQRAREWEVKEIIVHEWEAGNGGEK